MSTRKTRYHVVAYPLDNRWTPRELNSSKGTGKAYATVAVRRFLLHLFKWDSADNYRIERYGSDGSRDTYNTSTNKWEPRP